MADPELTLSPIADSPRVLFATNFLPAKGHFGTLVVNYALLDYLVQSGCTVHVCCFGRYGFDRPTISLDGEEVGPWTISLTGYAHTSEHRFHRLPEFRLLDLMVQVFRKLRLGRVVALSNALLTGAKTYVANMSARPFFALIARVILKLRLARVAVRSNALLTGSETFVANMGAKPFCAAPDFFDKRHFVRCLSHFSPHCVIVDYAFLSPLLELVEKGSSRTLRMILTHDLVCRRVESLRSRGLPDELAWDDNEEARQLRRADALLVEREDESAVFQALAPASRVLVTPLAVRPRRAHGSEVPGRCLFVGSGGAINEDGLGWFLDEVWPHVLAVRREASLAVCGTVCDHFMSDKESHRFPSVVWRGAVGSLDEDYASAQVCVVPLLAGSGFKTKLIEALSYGKVVVTTAVGAQGIGELESPPVLVANDAPAFRRALVEALAGDELRRKMAQRAVAYVERHLDPHRLYGPVVEMVYKHCGKGRSAIHWRMQHALHGDDLAE
jgi:hypothetical protein